MPTPAATEKPPYLTYARDWMRECRERALKAVPPEMKIPQEVWSYLPWGYRVVVGRRPMKEFMDDSELIEIPQNYRKPNAAGWVLSVGDEICNPHPARSMERHGS
jgi:hypothetical protein